MVEAVEVKINVDEFKAEIAQYVERIDRLEQAFINFASAVGAPDQYRQALMDLGLTPPAPVSGGGGFQQAAKR